MTAEVELKFSDDVPPDIAPLAADIAPTTDEILSCEECGKTLVYSGRGRKPKRCDEHKRAAGSTKGATVQRATNDKLATQATEALVQINRLTGFGARVIGLKETSETIAFCEDTFRAQAYEALLTDPALCKQILSAGAVSSKFSLALAYGMMGAVVVPVALAEIKAKREDKAAHDDGAQV